MFAAADESRGAVNDPIKLIGPALHPVARFLYF
jgi:hypothetical protein